VLVGHGRLRFLVRRGVSKHRRSAGLGDYLGGSGLLGALPPVPDERSGSAGQSSMFYCTALFGRLVRWWLGLRTYPSG
jgi:hypothetical protein